MNRPDDTSLPFFAYGIFKPGQLCYSRIRDLVFRNPIYCKVSGYLKERDGIPLLLLEKNGLEIKGYLIYFITGKEEDAYDRIIGIEPDKVYRWSKTNVEGVEANVLVGKSEKRGSFDLEYCTEWDGKDDPFFKQGLEEIEKILRENSSFDSEYRALLRLQMAYTLLWSAIERYAGLKYHLGKRSTEKVYKIAREKCFVDALQRIVHGKRTVRSATDLKNVTLDPGDPEKSIRYYYQVRSNAVHRGKAVTNDFNILKSSLEELLAIFKALLDESFRNEQ